MEQRMNSFSTKLIDGIADFCVRYFEDCLYYRGVYNVLYLVDHDKCQFGSYISTNFELGNLVSPDLSRRESASNIVYVINCDKFRNYDKREIKEMAYYMAFHLFGIINGVNLDKEFKLTDDTEFFVDKLNGLSDY